MILTSGRSVTRPLFVEPADAPRASALGNAPGGSAGSAAGIAGATGATGGAGPTGPNVRTGTLARTGSFPLDQVILGGAMLLLGTVAVVATARRFGRVRSRRTPRGRL